MFKLKKSKKRFLAILMLVLTIISSLPISAFATYITDMNSDAEFGVVPGSLSEYGHELHYANYGGDTYLLFCSEYGEQSPHGEVYEYDNEFRVELNSGAYQRAAEYIYFGYTMKYGAGLPNSLEAERAACAAQQFLWEYIRNNIDASFGAPGHDSWDPTYMSSSIYLNWLSETEQTYNSYHYSNVSFRNETRAVNIGESTILSDSNGILASYETFDVTKDGVNFKHTQGSNDLVITSDKNSDVENVTFRSMDYGMYRLMPTGARYSRNEMSSYMYFSFSEGAIQDLIFSSYVDPSYFGFNVEVQSGEILLKKVNTEGNIIEGCEFKLYKDLECTNEVASGISSADGTILFDKLAPGTYFIKEINVPYGYLLDTTIQRVEVQNRQRAEVEFSNTEPTGTISIIKRDSETGGIAQGDATLNGAVYKIYANEDIYNVAKTKKFYSKGDLVATRTTDENGNTEAVTELPLGKYIVKEDVASKGYLIDETEYEVNLVYKDQYTEVITDSATSNEKVKKMQVHIYKSGIKVQSGLVRGIEGAEFTIKLYSDVEKAKNAGYTYEEIWNGIDENGNKVNVDSQRVAEAQVIAPSYQTIATDSEGNAYSIELPYGKYIAKETVTPKDFYTALDFTFSIEKDKSEIPELAQKVKDLFVNDEQMESYIKLVKQDKASGKVVTLTSATFQIKATKDIYDRGNDKIVYKKGEVIKQKIGSTTYDSFTTNSQNLIVPEGSYNNDKEENGTVVTPLTLPVGSYEITEIKIPEGFLKLDSPVTFKIENVRDFDTDIDGDFIKTVIVENEQPTGTIIIDKSVALRENVDTSLVDITDLSGIEFELTAKTDITDKADGSTIYTANQVVGIYNIDKEGNLKIENLPMGEYELKEIKTLPELVLNDESYDFKFKKQDDTTKVYTQTRQIKNDTTLVDFSKKSITGQDELEGAKLTVIDSSGNVVDSWTSGTETHKIEGLQTEKEYTLREEITPDGFAKSTDIKFKVDNTNEIQKVEMIDKIVTITKTDLTNGEELEGAELIVTDEEGNEIDKWTSTKEPHQVTGLEEGKTYTLTEITCPYGYEQAESITFTVTTDKETQVVEMKDMPILKNIRIIKADSSSKETIKSQFTFGLYEDKECTKLIKQMDSNKDDGTVTFEDLRYGTYYIKEISAPKGYQLSDKVVEIRIDDKGVFADNELLEETDGAYSFTFYDDLIPVVHTGNEISNVILIITAVLSFIATIVGVVIFKRRNKEIY